MRICIFAGSSQGSESSYFEAAEHLGRLLAQRGIGVVYGGASVGLMAAVADSAKRAGGEVIGVIPSFIAEREIAHNGLDELRVVDTMHERKATMFELSDAFVAIPGGIGTLEEIFEVWTWGQLNQHQKPCGLLNIAGFHDPLIQFLDSLVTRQFLRPEHRDMLVVETTPEGILSRISNFQAPSSEKWTS